MRCVESAVRSSVLNIKNNSHLLVNDAMLLMQTDVRYVALVHLEE